METWKELFKTYFVSIMYITAPVGELPRYDAHEGKQMLKVG